MLALPKSGALLQDLLQLWGISCLTRTRGGQSGQLTQIANMHHARFSRIKTLSGLWQNACRS